jgi:hypothetical protein
MNVGDCLTEYETIGAKVFGHWRPYYYRYSAKRLEKVIREVVSRNCQDRSENRQNKEFGKEKMIQPDPDRNSCRA